jgi:hypothetical protein
MSESYTMLLAGPCLTLCEKASHKNRSNYYQAHTKITIKHTLKSPPSTRNKLLACVVSKIYEAM